jgi:AraC family transcriptional activator of mtrCDE
MSSLDWLSRLFEMITVRGRLDLRCLYGAPWRIDQGPAEAGAIPYHAILAGSAMLEDPSSRRPIRLNAGDILLLRKIRNMRSWTAAARVPLPPKIARPSIF